MSYTCWTTRKWVEGLKPGALVASKLTGDIGKVLERRALGLMLHWRVGVTEFVLFSDCAFLTKPEWRRKVAVLIQRMDTDPETPPAEQRRIRAAIAEMRAEKRARGEYCNPAYAVADEPGVREAATA